MSKANLKQLAVEAESAIKLLYTTLPHLKSGEELIAGYAGDVASELQRLAERFNNLDKEDYPDDN